LHVRSKELENQIFDSDLRMKKWHYKCNRQYYDIYSIPFGLRIEKSDILIWQAHTKVSKSSFVQLIQTRPQGVWLELFGWAFRSWTHVELA